MAWAASRTRALNSGESIFTSFGSSGLGGSFLSSFFGSSLPFDGCVAGSSGGSSGTGGGGGPGPPFGPFGGAGFAAGAGPGVSRNVSIFFDTGAGTVSP